MPSEPFLLSEKSEGVTTELALELADRAYVLVTGNIVLEGSGRELLEAEMVKKAYLGM